MQNDELKKQITQQLQKIDEEKFLHYLYILICDMLSKQSKNRERKE